jgi:hypothetical protein
MNLDCLNSPITPRLGYFICATLLLMVLYGVISTSSVFKVISERNKEKDNLPPWTKYPRTRFTDHILELIDDFNASAATNCGVYVQLTVKDPYLLLNAFTNSMNLVIGVAH